MFNNMNFRFRNSFWMSACTVALTATAAYGASPPEYLPESEKLTASLYDYVLGESVAVGGDSIMAGGADDWIVPLYDVHVFSREPNDGWSDSYLLYDGNRNEDFTPGTGGIDIDGNRALIGDCGFFTSARSYEFASDGQWNDTGGFTLNPPGDPGSGGCSPVSLDGETAIFSFRGDTISGIRIDTTAVYQFAAGAWAELQSLGPASPSVIDEGIILQGDPDGDGVVADTGIVRVLVPDGSGFWQPMATLAAADGQPGAAFGKNVAINGPVALIGAPGDNEAGVGAGAAYAFVRTASGSWQLEAKLLPGVTAGREAFGTAVALGDGIALVKQIEPREAPYWRGRRHILVFARDGAGSWKEVGELVSSEGFQDDDFGWDFDVDEKTAVVGAPAADSIETGSGAVYVYELASLLDRPPLGNFNALVSFEPNPASFVSSGVVAEGCQADSVGTFRFTAMLGNISANSLRNLHLEISELSRGNRLLTPQGLLSEGNRSLVPADGAYADGELAPSEFVDVPFTICLASRDRFRFVVDVLGRHSEDAAP